MRCLTATKEKCSICDEKTKCVVFHWFYRKNKESYESFLKEYAEKYSEKYELSGVLKMSKENKQVLVIDPETNTIIDHIDDTSKISSDKIASLTGKRLVEVSGKEYEVILTLKQKGYIPYGDKTKKSKSKSTNQPES